MLKNKQQAHSSEKTKKGSIRKLYGFLAKKLERGLGSKNSITTIMHMQSGHFGQLDVTHFTNLCRQKDKQNMEALLASQSDRMFEEVQERASDPQEQRRLWKLQVSKCYRRIPASFFEEEHPLTTSLLTRNKQKSMASQFELTDYLDEVEFNLTTHVNSRFKEFFQFITSISHIELLVESNLERLHTIRQQNQRIQRQLVQKAEHVARLRLRADNLSRYRTALDNSKRMVCMPRDIRQAFPRDKTRALYLFNLYKSLHDRSRLYCCLNKKTSCRFEEVREYLRQNFQVAFTKSFWSYITEVIVYDSSTLQGIFGLNKKEFMTTPNFLRSLAEKPTVEDSRFEEPQQIVIKHSVETEINWIAVNGFTLCQLSCNTLIKDLQEFIGSFQKNFLSDLVNKIKESFDMACGNHLLTLSKSRQTLISELEQLFERVGFGKYAEVVQSYSEMMKKVVKRCLSLVNRILQSFCKLKPPNLRQLEDSLLEVADVVLDFSTTGLLSIVKLKRIGHEFQANHFKDLLKSLQEWAQFSKQMMETYVQPLPIFGSSIQRTQNMLESMALQSLRKSYMQSYFSCLHQYSLSNRLKKALECDNWQEVDIEPDYFQSLGYLLEGEQFLQNRRNKLLASSILFQKKAVSNTHIQLPCKQFRVTNKQIVIRERRFKSTSSTLQLLETLQEYLKIYQSCRELGREIADRLIQLLKAYTSYLEELILKGKALQLKRIKGNSITARHLSLCYLALEIILELLPSINKHLPLPSDDHHRLVQKLHGHQDEIIKNFHKVMIITMEQECKLVDLRPPVPSQGTRKILDHIRSMYDILVDYFTQQDMRKFFSRYYLQKYVNTLQQLRPTDQQQAELKRQEIGYFLKEFVQYQGILTDYDKICRELSQMLTK